MKRIIKLVGILLFALLLMSACHTSRKATNISSTSGCRTATEVVKSVSSSEAVASESKATATDTTRISSGVSTRIAIGRDSMGRPNLLLINSTGNLLQTGVSAFNLKEGITGTKAADSEIRIFGETETREMKEIKEPRTTERAAITPWLVTAIILIFLWIVGKIKPGK